MLAKIYKDFLVACGIIDEGRFKEKPGSCFQREGDVESLYRKLDDNYSKNIEVCASSVVSYQNRC